MRVVGLAVFFVSVCGIVYPYLVYPAILRLIALFKAPRPVPPEPEEWPRVSITMSVYNERGQIAETLESLLALDYPESRRQILIVSDASDDGTDDVVRGYADRGVELMRLRVRGGKTAAENAARTRLTGDIVVNTDASVRLDTAAIKALVRHFGDETVGVASGRDISVARTNASTSSGESTYVGYEMWLRDLETAVRGIVGSSGSLYAIRRSLHLLPVPDFLSRDFGSALTAMEHGYRAISVPDALCIVPRAPSLQREYRRKVRTITRGMETLAFKRRLLNGSTYGIFSWMLFSHKVARWVASWALLGMLAGVMILAPHFAWAAWGLVGAVIVLLVACAGIVWPGDRAVPRPLAIPASILLANLAVLHATVRALVGDQNAVWEPTRREAA